ncbi:hypothetical protein OBBRIDRAFT_740809 [Obba rivulosa]|uniref:Uncharacterized protein n=1 Tax=Obba rivulosa TaxID=1052685 RepID=A0A8E2AI48_9APHY|nr:hypothetical protein OBBRIDRAFT_740809 [Obba rivulosa]
MGHDVVIHILSQIEIIKFAYDWNVHDKQKEGKVWKTCFLKKTFYISSPYSTQFAELDKRAHSNKMKELKKKFATWKHA